MELKVMSFNLRYDKPDLGKNAWTVRKDAVAALIDHYAPDIIGTQEGKAHQLLDLHRLLPDYQSLGYDRTGTGTDEYCAIFYRPGRLQCLKSNDFFLSDTPELPGSISSDWGNSVPRMASWAVFAIVGEKQKIIVFNTHFDYKSVKAQELSARLICDRACVLLQAEDMGHLELAESYLFITGDFNAAPGTAPREALQHPFPNGLHLHDALAGVELEHQLSFHDFTGKAFLALDTIYYDSRLTLQQVKVDTLVWQGIFPSDHFPVIADFVSAP